VDPDARPAPAPRGILPDETGEPIGPDDQLPTPGPTGERATETLSRLRLASRALNQSPPVAEALEVLVRQALAPLPIRAAVIGLVRPNRTLQIVGTMGMGDEVRSRYLALGLDDRVPLTDAALRGVPVWLHDLDELGRRYPHMLSTPDRAEASATLPLIVDDRTVGAFGIACDRPANFAADERILLFTVSDLCAAYLDRIGLVRVEARSTLRRRSTDGPAPAARSVSVASGAQGTAGSTGPATAQVDPASRRGTSTSPDPFADGVSIDLRHDDDMPGQESDEQGRDLQLLASFIAHSPVALSLFDRDLRFVMVNDKMAEINGLAVADHIGRAVGDVVPALAGQNERLMERVLRTAAAIEGVELSGPTLGHPDGGDWLVNYYPVHDASGEVFGVGATVTEVTATNRRERLLQEAFTERDHIARVLQQSLLPVQPPQLPGLSIATLYLPAGEGNAVGGDFYDVFPTDRAFHLVVGDVCGQGAEAAALTGFARDTLRATAGLDEDPVTSLLRLNDLLLGRSSDYRFITVAHIVIERAARRRATVALAGHPHPLLVRQGKVLKLGTPGSLLGVHAHVQIKAERLTLEPGDLLLAYTDGLTDQARAPIDDDELQVLAASMGELPAQAVVEAVRAHLHERRSGMTSDDTLVLAVRVEAL
jgi:PAS domain S-box-containing protein